MGWFWLLLIPGVPALLCMGRISVRLTYDDGGFKYKLSFAGLTIPLDRKSARRGRRPRRPIEKTAKPPPLSPGDIPSLIGPALESAGRIANRCRVRRLRVRYIVGGKKDPAKAALRSGQAWAAGSAFFTMAGEVFKVSPNAPALIVDCDFDAQEDTLTADVLLSWRLGSLLAAGLRLVWAYVTSRRGGNLPPVRNT